MHDESVVVYSVRQIYSSENQQTISTIIILPPGGSPALCAQRNGSKAAWSQRISQMEGHRVSYCFNARRNRRFQGRNVSAALR